MKIRLTRTLVVEPNHGCTRGTEWEVNAVITGKSPKTKCPRYVFMSEAGQFVVAMNDEAVVTDHSPPERTFSFTDYYEQPEDSEPPDDD